jgi:hypothetical protein
MGAVCGLTRADFLHMGAAALLAGCTPVRILLHDYAGAYDERAVAEPAIRAFVATVIPGARIAAPDLARAFFDADYPFARYAGFFASDLAARARRLRRGASFTALEPANRTAVVRAGLSGDDATRRLYAAAIFIAQASFYAGIYDDEAGCPLIDFHGAREVLPPAEQAHPVPERFFGPGLTGDGNYR